LTHAASGSADFGTKLISNFNILALIKWELRAIIAHYWNVIGVTWRQTGPTCKWFKKC